MVGWSMAWCRARPRWWWMWWNTNISDRGDGEWNTWWCSERKWNSTLDVISYDYENRNNATIYLSTGTGSRRGATDELNIGIRIIIVSMNNIRIINIIVIIVIIIVTMILCVLWLYWLQALLYYGSYIFLHILVLYVYLHTLWLYMWISEWWITILNARRFRPDFFKSKFLSNPIP